MLLVYNLNYLLGIISDRVEVLNEIRSGLNLGGACYYAVHSILSLLEGKIVFRKLTHLCTDVRCIGSCSFHSTVRHGLAI
jgi:hypothetical protein